jgi:hypothetical protein
VLRRPVESALHSPVAVVDEPVEDLAGSGAVPDGHLQGVDGQVGAQTVGDLPADHHAGVHVDDDAAYTHPEWVFT